MMFSSSEPAMLAPKLLRLLHALVPKLHFLPETSTPSGK
jgi:hypothetical protein